MEGPNFYELEPPAPAAAANGEMAIFVHTHTHKLYLQRRNITLEEALLNIFLELKECFGQDNFKDI